MASLVSREAIDYFFCGSFDRVSGGGVISHMYIFLHKPFKTYNCWSRLALNFCSV